MATTPSQDPTMKETARPGDEVLSDSPGSGDDVCPRCNGSGSIHGQECEDRSGYPNNHPRDRRRLTMDKSSPNDVELSEAARRQLEKVETGDTDAARKVDQIRKVASSAVDAAEQEASDGPKGLGVAR